MTIFYYPTLLGFVASTLAYVFNPDLADNGVYTGIVIVVVFWLGVFMSARGGTGGIAKLASSGLLIGTLIPGAILVILGVVYLLQGNPSAAPMDADHLIPKWTGHREPGADRQQLPLLLGHGDERGPRRVAAEPRASEFPRAMFFACGLVLLIFILPALAISWVIPADELSLTAGVMQAFDAFFAYFNLQKLVPIVAIALVCASAGGMLTWLAGPVEGPAADRAPRGLPAAVLPAAERERGPGPHPRRPGRGHDRDRAALRAGPVGLERLLDPQRDDDAGLPDRLPADVRRGASTCASAQPDVERGYTAPALSFLCVVGFLASAAAILIGFVPPSQFENGSDGAYVGLILAGTVLLGLLPPWLFLKFRKPSWKLADAEESHDAPSESTVRRRPPHARTGSSAASSSCSAIIGLITYSGKKDDRAGAGQGRSS